MKSIQLQQVGEHLIHVTFPLWNVCNGKDCIDSIVATRINGLDKKTIHFKNAQDIAVLNDTLCQTYAVVPHVGRFLIEGQSIEGIEFHEKKDVVVQCLTTLRKPIRQGFNRSGIPCTFQS